MVGAGLCPRPVFGGRWRFCRGQPACRPVGVFWAEACPGGHIGPPLRDGGAFRTNGNWRGNGPCQQGGRSPLPTGGRSRLVCPRRRGEVTPPYGCNTGSAKQRADVGIGPYGKERKPHQPPGPAAHSGAFAARVRRNGWESRQSSPPKWPATSDNPSVSLRLTAPFTQGSLWGRGMRIAASLRSSQ